MDFLKRYKKVQDNEEVENKMRSVDGYIKSLGNKKLKNIDIIIEGVKDKSRLKYCYDEIESCIHNNIINIEELEVAIKRISDHINFKNVEIHVVKKPNFTLFSKPFYFLNTSKPKRKILLFVDESKSFNGGVFGGIENNKLFGRTNMIIKNKLPGFSTLKVNMKVEGEGNILNFGKNTKNDKTAREKKEIKNIPDLFKTHTNMNKPNNRISISFVAPDIKLTKKSKSAHDISAYSEISNLKISKKRETTRKNSEEDKIKENYVLNEEETSSSSRSNNDFVNNGNNNNNIKPKGKFHFPNFTKLPTHISSEQLTGGFSITRYFDKTVPFESTQGTFASIKSSHRGKGKKRITGSINYLKTPKINSVEISNEYCFENGKGYLSRNISAALGVGVGLFSSKVSDENEEDHEESFEGYNFSEESSREGEDWTSSKKRVFQNFVSKSKPYYKLEACSSAHLPLYKKLVVHVSTAVGFISTFDDVPRPMQFSKVNNSIPNPLMFNLYKDSLPGFSNVQTNIYASGRASLTLPVFGAFTSILGLIAKKQGKKSEGSVIKLFKTLSNNIEITPFVQCTRVSHEKYLEEPILHGGVSVSYKKSLCGTFIFGGEENFCLGLNISY